jgi:predicted metal-dependent peptidase
MRQGFIAPFVCGMNLIESPDLPQIANGCKTMATDGTSIYWYPPFVEACSDEQIEFTLAHEGLHPAFLHHIRQGNRNPDKWNMACDYAINPILRDAKMIPPPNILFDFKFDGKTADWIYEQLPDGIPQGGWNIGGVIPFKGTPEEKKVHEQQWITKFVSAAQTAKGIGTLPAGIDRILTDLTAPKINWKAVLQRFLTATIKNDYNWNRPNRRYINQGLYLPHLQSPTLGNGVIYMDTSCSVGERELNQLGSETKAITDVYYVDLDIIYVDTVVAGHDHIEAMNPHCKLEPKGGGGTSFAPGFEYVEKQGIQPKFGLYLTDGGSHDFPKSPPSYPLIWVLTEKYHGFKPPFGEILTMPTERRTYDS